MGRPDYSGSVITSAKYLKQTKVSVTTANTVHTLQDESKALLIINQGSGLVYWEVEAAATTNKAPIWARRALGIDIDAETIQFICGAGDSATVHVIEFG